MILQTSAPAKIILLGEHAVVYGQPAIAVPVSSVRAMASLKPSVNASPNLWPSLVDLASSGDELNASHAAFSAVMQTLLDRLGLSLQAAEITLHSDVPIASGLGSGAAVSSALARSLFFFQSHKLDEDLLNEIVYEAEKIHHGTPSGIDNSVIVYEKPIYFKRGFPVERLVINSPLSLLIGDTGRRSPTRDAVAEVRRLYESSPHKMQDVFDSIGKLVVKAREALSLGHLENLGSHMTENHHLLRQLTVSSPELDQLVTAALHAGALGAKLSGGGRGGNMIALVKPDQSAPVREHLLNAGATRVIQTTII